MAVDYTVIQPVRQRFGDGDYRWEENDERETEAPYAGHAKEFPFSCPNIDSSPSQHAVLHFESFGLTVFDNTLEINTVPVPGGLKPAGVTVVAGSGSNRTAYSYSFWKAHELLVPQNVLDEQNVLKIGSAIMDDDNNYDNFIIDNVVIFFKTRSGGFGPVIGG